MAVSTGVSLHMMQQTFLVFKLLLANKTSERFIRAVCPHMHGATGRLAERFVALEALKRPLTCVSSDMPKETQFSGERLFAQNAFEWPVCPDWNRFERHWRKN